MARIANAVAAPLWGALVTAQRRGYRIALFVVENDLRRRHARRVIRSAHPDSNREDQKFFDRDHGDRLLEGTARLQEQMAQRGMIANADLSLIYATDSVEEAIAHIRTKAIEPFGLKRVPRRRRHFPWLGERGLSGL